MSTSRPFWILSLTVCKIYYTYIFIFDCFKGTSHIKKKIVNIRSHHKDFLSFAVKQSCVSPLNSQSCRLLFNLRRRSVPSTIHHVFTCNLKAGATAPPAGSYWPVVLRSVRSIFIGKLHKKLNSHKFLTDIVFIVFNYNKGLECVR